MRQKPASNGTRLVAYQCLDCGQAASHWLKQASIPNVTALPIWDASIAERIYAEQRRAREERIFLAHGQAEAANDEWWAKYNAYLRTPAWRARRSLVMQRAGGWCEGCRKQEATQVHHLTYAHVSDEFLWELVAICDDCHIRIHADRDEANK
jgi:hypothetical protein